MAHQQGAAGRSALMVVRAVDPLLIDLAARECITAVTRAWSLRERFRCQKCKRRPPKRMWIENDEIEASPIWGMPRQLSIHRLVAMLRVHDMSRRRYEAVLLLRPRSRGPR
jgi:hypothetical protein